MDRNAEERIWFAVCAGERCSLCESEMRPPRGHAGGMLYCRPCVPDPNRQPHRVSIHIDHQLSGWMVTISSREDTSITYWMVNVSDRQLIKLARFGRCPRRRLHELLRDMRQWGRGSLWTHYNDLQHANLVRAWKADPRNGAEKLRSRQHRETGADMANVRTYFHTKFGTR